MEIAKFINENETSVLQYDPFHSKILDCIDERVDENVSKVISNSKVINKLFNCAKNLKLSSVAELKKRR